ncbi:hypothetical protein DIZ27_24620 [Streptomyces sp. NWU339]|uniref:hypothetical protein n=1 Tax=Streptomyces sp. NWU339 TaxID=2185284 RepID=UPI000D675864|nr:hypothetical protein [Streptomyces sp. NWU339]PWI08107.1 hypothetical protein DIZ27_24620 [Streptomyces sp. NWU339]
MNTPRRVTPRRLGAAAALYGVFVAGWYLGQPVTPECHVDQAARDRIAEEYETAPSPTPTPTGYPSRYDSKSPLPLDPTPDPASHPPGGASDRWSQTITIYAVACTNDTSERPRMRAWFQGHWR